MKMALARGHLSYFRRSIATAVSLQGKKGRIPYDKRFPVTAKHINERKPGGNKEFREKWGRRGQAGGGSYVTGYTDSEGKFHEVPEMVPEYIVPDLTDFQLKPYVPHNVQDVVQSEFTAKNLFDATIGKDVKEKFRKGEITIDEIKSMIQNSSAKSLPENSTVKES